MPSARPGDVMLAPEQDAASALSNRNDGRSGNLELLVPAYDSFEAGTMRR